MKIASIVPRSWSLLKTKSLARRLRSKRCGAAIACVAACSLGLLLFSGVLRGEALDGDRSRTLLAARRRGGSAPFPFSCFKCSRGEPSAPSRCRLEPFEAVPDDFYPEQRKGGAQCHSNLAQHPWQEWVFSGKTAWEVGIHDYEHYKEAPKLPSGKALAWQTLGGAAKVEDWYLNEVDQTESSKVWDGALLAEWADARETNRFSKYPYGEDCKLILDALSRYKNSIEDQSGAVIGSLDPWIEEYLLALGAEHVTTVEYGKILSKVPKISAMTPPELEMVGRQADGAAGAQFDFIVSYSSLEHTGLGRYGDPLNPVGDLQAIARLSCILKPGGLFFVGFPIAAQDTLVWNAHRIYGPERLAFVAENFRLLSVAAADRFQPLMVMQNIRGCANAWARN